MASVFCYYLWMIIPTKKLDSGFEIPVFGFGGWRIGGSRERDPHNDDPADIAAIRYAIEAGITHFDTAEKYAAGFSEKLFGQAIKDCNRKELFITSKVADTNLGYTDVIEALHRSLERIGTDYLDLYLIHSPNPNISIQETMSAMDTLVEKKLIKNVGVSNFDVEQFRAAQASTKNKIVTNQVYYNLAFRLPEHDDMLPYCQHNDVLLTAWRPIDKGILAKSGTEILDRIASKYKKTPAQIAINWLISQDKVITISKMRDKEHINENLGALGWQMEPEDIELLRKEFPDQLSDYEEAKQRLEVLGV